MSHDTEPTVSSDHVTVVSTETYEKMLASLDEPTEMSKALAEAARRQREIVRSKD